MDSNLLYDREKIDYEAIFKSKLILITGACGSIGKNLAKKLLMYKPGRLRLLDIDDSKLTELQDELVNETNAKSLRFLLGDIRDKDRLVRAFEGIDYVFHCAALKHVSIGEYNPREVIQTNILGTENVIEAALINNVKKVIYTSSDKAVNPINTMGASKLIGEKLIVAANFIRGSRQTRFSGVRFGNVLGSRGSIIPRFKKRVEKGKKLIVTDPNMTRFMMPNQDAVRLMLEALAFSFGGEIFVMKMPCLKLSDLVDLFTEFAWMNYGVIPEVEVVGLFSGEKNFEELMTEEELPRAIEINSMYVILPHIRELLPEFPSEISSKMGKLHSKVFNSNFASPLSKKELKDLIESFNIFQEC